MRVSLHWVPAGSCCSFPAAAQGLGTTPPPRHRAALLPGHTHRSGSGVGDSEKEGASEQGGGSRPVYVQGRA